MRRLTMLLLAPALLAPAFGATPVAQKSFTWDRTSFFEAVDAAAKTFQVRVFLGEGTHFAVSTEMHVDSFEKALTVLTMRNRVPVVRFYVPRGSELTFDQAELLARMSNELKNVKATFDGGGSNFQWGDNSPTPNSRTGMVPVYFVGYTRNPRQPNTPPWDPFAEPAPEKSFLRFVTPQWQTVYSRMSAPERFVFNAVWEMNLGQRDQLRAFLDELNPQRADDLVFSEANTVYVDDLEMTGR